MYMYHIVGFFEVLKFREWLIFGFFMILFSRMGLPKAHTLQWVVGFFEGLNFTNDQHPRNLQNLRTSKKTNYTVYPSSCEHLHYLEKYIYTLYVLHLKL